VSHTASRKQARRDHVQDVAGAHMVTRSHARMHTKSHAATLGLRAPGPYPGRDAVRHHGCEIRKVYHAVVARVEPAEALIPAPPREMNTSIQTAVTSSCMTRVESIPIPHRTTAQHSTCKKHVLVRSCAHSCGRSPHVHFLVAQQAAQASKRLP
jgi:hypothetical protein